VTVDVSLLNIVAVEWVIRSIKFDADGCRGMIVEAQRCRII
jgi:hypothetical protein